MARTGSGAHPFLHPNRTTTEDRRRPEPSPRRSSCRWGKGRLARATPVQADDDRPCARSPPGWQGACSTRWPSTAGSRPGRAASRSAVNPAVFDRDLERRAALAGRAPVQADATPALAPVRPVGDPTVRDRADLQRRRSGRPGRAGCAGARVPVQADDDREPMGDGLPEMDGAVSEPDDLTDRDGEPRRRWTPTPRCWRQWKRGECVMARPRRPPSAPTPTGPPYGPPGKRKTGCATPRWPTAARTSCGFAWRRPAPAPCCVAPDYRRWARDPCRDLRLRDGSIGSVRPTAGIPPGWPTGAPLRDATGHQRIRLRRIAAGRCQPRPATRPTRAAGSPHGGPPAVPRRPGTQIGRVRRGVACVAETACCTVRVAPRPRLLNSRSRA